MAERPAHHNPAGGYRNPWQPEFSRVGGLLRWQLERLRRKLPPNPPPTALPAVASRIVQPRAPGHELRATWVGQATFLLQAGGLNILTDPHWGDRASPLTFAGPARLAAPGVPWDALPPIDAVVLSHDHYDHLDAGTVRRIAERFGDAVQWLAPLGYRAWLERRGARRITELDWWQDAEITGPGGTLHARALPAQHWTSRTPFDRQRRLWASWFLWAEGGPRVYFAGDSGYFDGYREIGERCGPFDLALLPIGAYEPRWFMKPAHMNPEDAVAAYRALGGTGLFAGMHWGTWRLTDEDPLEPPVRTRAAWAAAALPEGRLWIPAHGETAIVPAR
jgi:N-acyl-phosphatidylethanolamine-hydrolysing phospholipase D